MTDRTGFQLWQKPNRTTMWLILKTSSTWKTKLSSRDWSNLRSMTKTKEDNDVTKKTNVVYIKNNIELSWLIWLGVIYEENQTIQWHDRSCRYNLRRKMKLSCFDRSNSVWLWQKSNKTMTWWIVQVWFTSKTILNCRDRLDWVQIMMKTR